MKIKSMAGESMNGLMEGNTMAIGKITTCMAKVSTLGKMGESTMGSTSTIGSTASELTHGKTEDNMLATG